MAKMKPRRKASKQNEVLSSGPNWALIGGIIGVAAIALIALALTSTFNPQAAADPTPVLSDTVVDAAGYCRDFPERCIAVGNPDSNVSMVEVVDYGCPHCADFNRNAAPTLLENYVENDQVGWYVLPFALGNQTKPSAEAVMCANEQGADLALEFHENLFLLQGTGDEHTDAGFSSVAERVEGMNVSELESCLAAERHIQGVSFNQQAARQLGVESTPSFFLNGRLIRGNQDVNVFIAQLDAALN